MYGNSYDVGAGGGISSTLAKTMGLHSHWGLSAGFDVLETRINGEKMINVFSPPKTTRYFMQECAEFNLHLPRCFCLFSFR